ncbi:hypothetical protein NKR23_g6314 [Pleurostoma richardsiae]|uniref:Uncharacterized protein n=1 Tax=Pleurostoma richardsiae TaxID=41990 RepID=A0AA38RPR2_9PEZI|nr:hypothetical protein NKR23_g6314 [Pleurostoma richardsiae]
MSSNDSANLNPTEEPNTYKPHLDKAADKFRHPHSDKNEGNNEGGEGLVDKVSQYVPAVGKILGHQEQQEQKKPAAEERPHPSIPPLRPHHDTQIEEFVRDQHRSRPEDQIVDQ